MKMGEINNLVPSYADSIKIAEHKISERIKLFKPLQKVREYNNGSEFYILEFISNGTVKAKRCFDGVDLFVSIWDLEPTFEHNDY